MAKILVQKFTPKQTNNGKTKYACIGTIDGEIDQFDMWNQPELNKEFDGNVKDDPKWGKTVLTGQGGGGGARTGYANDPETRMEIIRQNALTNAVNYVLTKASFMTKEAALKYINGKEIIQVATYFAKFSKGEVTVVNPSGRAQNAPQATETPYDDITDLADVPTQPEPPQAEIGDDMDEPPF